jgi:hypothetical protein
MQSKDGVKNKAPGVNGKAGKPSSQGAKGASQKNPAAVALGRLGGKKGGLARAAKLTKKQRSAIARKAARARWRSNR